MTVGRTGSLTRPANLPRFPRRCRRCLSATPLHRLTVPASPDLTAVFASLQITVSERNLPASTAPHRRVRTVGAPTSARRHRFHATTHIYHNHLRRARAGGVSRSHASRLDRFARFRESGSHEP